MKLLSFSYSALLFFVGAGAAHAAGMGTPGVYEGTWAKPGFLRLFTSQAACQVTITPTGAQVRLFNGMDESLGNNGMNVQSTTALDSSYAQLSTNGNEIELSYTSRDELTYTTKIDVTLGQDGQSIESASVTLSNIGGTDTSLCTINH